MPDAARNIWILSPREDLVWFQGSVVAGVGLLIFFLLVHDHGGVAKWAAQPTMLAVFLWGVLFDGTHVWGTYARTYFAPDDGSRAGLPGNWSWGLMAIGPLFALSAAALGLPGLFGLFLVLAYLWAYWHLVRQHYGFIMLYRRRAGETDARGARLDSLLLWLGCLYPFVRFTLSDAYHDTGLPRLVPPAYLAAAGFGVDVVFGIAGIVLLMIVFSQRIEALRLGPKHLLMSIVIGFHILVFTLLGNLLAIVATLTIFHNLQYHRIVWQYERGQGRVPSGGLASYLVHGILFGLIWYGARVGATAVQYEILRNVLVGLGWGVAFHHYLVDGRIWHVRRSNTVSRALEAGATS